MSTPDRITLHTTWRHLLAGAAGAGLVAAGGTYGVVTAGVNLVTAFLFLLGWGLVAVLVLDVPVASTFSSEGVQRRMLLRRQFLRWQPGDALTRARPSFVRSEERLRQGGLVLRRGKRRYLLVDKAESADEFATLLRVVDVEGEPGAELHLAVPDPPDDAPPTWLYRRRAWRPDGAPDR